MSRTTRQCLVGFVLIASSIPLALDGCEASLMGKMTKIQHVVIVVQENRTPDNLFHDPVLIAHGADIASTGLNSFGITVPLSATGLGVGYDLAHGHAEFVAMYDGGKMDGANNISVHCSGALHCPQANAQFLFVDPSDVQPYFQMAEQYTFGDRMFQTMKARVSRHIYFSFLVPLRLPRRAVPSLPRTGQVPRVTVRRVV